MNSVRNQTETKAFILSSGGFVGYDYEYDSRGYRVEDAEPPTPTWLIELLGIDWLHRIVWVDLRGKPVGNYELEQVSSLRSLRGLSIYGSTNITNDSIQNISNLQGLQRLRLGLGKTTVEGLHSLRPLTNLEQLTIHSPIDDSYLPELVQLPSLKRLRICGAFTEDGLRSLQQSKSMRFLKISSKLRLSPSLHREFAENAPELKIDDGSFDDSRFQFNQR